MDPVYLINVSAIGIIIGLIALVIFLINRIRWILPRSDTTAKKGNGLISDLRNLLLIILLLAISAMFLFIGFFLKAYLAFTDEEPVAEVSVLPSEGPKTIRVKFKEFNHNQNQFPQEYNIRGDQWVLEGDILKWDHWLKFMGLQTRYRFTRLRGRYLHTEEEIRGPRTIYSLVRREDHWGWRLLYQYGHQFPFISTVYGNAVFQYNRSGKRYLVYVGSSGFIVREENKPIQALN
ncbi:MAG: hypothetical protein GWN16_01075 [Calditrichae bacterium]|nr:hypothetical protein [Calditrichia bacterium]